MSLLLHPSSEIAINEVKDANAHAVLLVGPTGSGKFAVAQQLARQLLEAHDATTMSGLKIIEPLKNSIGIGEIRQIQAFLRLKTTGQRPIRRVLIIKDAQYMTIEAQNAFLKLLEEPPEDTRVILTLESGQTLLPTIHSRVQHLQLQSPDKTAIGEHFAASGHSTKDIEKAFLLTGGMIGLMSGMLDSATDHPLLEYVERAKRFLASTAYQRLVQLDSFAKDREELELFLQALDRTSVAAFENSISNHKTAQAEHWHSIRKQLKSLQATLPHTPNVKLLLTDLSLNL